MPIRIVHSHSTNAPGNKLHYYVHHWNKLKIHKIANYYFACGKLAEEWMYSGSKCQNDVQIINNGIDVNKFCFNESVRNEVRAELGLSDEYVIGHVGRFSQVKNHKFLIDIFEKICTNNDKKVKPLLLLVGVGELQEEIIQICKTKKIYENVIFLGARNDVHRLLQAMDAFVLPSIYEGFPVSAIEAQAAGLPCFLSDSITKDSKLKTNVHMISLHDTAEQWAFKILENTDRIVENEVLFQMGYDLGTTLQKLEEVYLLGDIDKCIVQ